MSGRAPLGAAIFASGGGTNAQALLDHQGPGTPWRVRLLVADRPGIGALERAERAGVPTRVVPTRDREAGAIAAETLEALSGAGVDVIFLAGYVKLVPGEVIAAYRGRILNVHPALLPAFGGKGMWGMHVHRAVLAAGARVSGPTVHLVDEEYDRGAIVAQWPVPVLGGDTPEVLAERVLRVEHRLYPLAADHACATLAEGREIGPLSLPGTAFRLADDVNGADPAGLPGPTRTP